MDNLPQFLYYSRHNPGMVSIRSHGQQAAFAGLARELHAERIRTGMDALQRGESMSDLLDANADDTDDMTRYYRHLVARYSRMGDVDGVRRTLAELGRNEPLGIKYRLVWVASFFGSRSLRWLTRLWDSRT